MTVADKPLAWPTTLPHLVTEVPGPKALAQVAADQAVVSNSLPRAYPIVPVRGEGVVVEDIDDSSIADAPRKLVLVDRRKAGLLGVSQQAIATTLRAGLAGELYRQFAVTITIAVVISGFVALLIGNFSLQKLPSSLVSGSQGWVLLAIPTFVFAGNLMERCGMSYALVSLARALVGR
mgnify:CR=1 FL=1